MNSRKSTGAGVAGLALLGLGTAAPLSAQEPAAVVVDEVITVTATRVPAPGFDVPASIDVLSAADLHDDRLGIDLSESLPGVPGVLARNRQNYAQDTQVSIRGFGSRATFGIRGLRLYLDGIPATQPDGQAQMAHFNLASAERLEILRGPFSSLYGNASGGVMQLFTKSGRDAPRFSGGTAAGSFGTWRANLGGGGSVGAADYVFDFTRFDTEGYREHSAARRESFNGKLDYRFSERSRSTVVLNYFDSPETDDPLGLTRAQFDQDPSQATPQAEQFRTNKSTRQSQIGLVHEFDFTPAQTLRAAAYLGNRDVEQFLSVTTGAQNAPRSAGGVVDLDSDYGGADLRWSWRRELSGRPFTLVAGLTYDELSQDRRGFNNFVGSTLGVRGDLRRDEVNDIDNFDQYLQVGYDFGERWSALAGIRHSKVRFESDDRFITVNDPDNPADDNPDDSGKADYSATTPVAGLSFRYSPAINLYASYGEGFESPTFAEAAYRPDGGSGLNLGLDAATTDTGEMGAKLRLSPATRAQVALFHARTEDEIVVATNTGGRSTFQNAGRTRRQGAELQLQTRLLPRLDAQIAWTYLEAEVREDYQACTTAPPCAAAARTTIPKGNRLPGVPESSLYAALGWSQGETGWHAGLDARYMDEVPANDVNDESAPSFTLVGLDAGYVFALPLGRLRTFVRVDNVFDEEYVGSVIVNDGNRRYYEPGPEANVLAGLRFDWKP